MTKKRGHASADPEHASPPLDPAEVARAIEVLARVAEDRGALAGVDAATRERLQRIAGELARPDARQRRQLRKALARGERDARKARDGALRKATGIRKLREAPVFRAPLPELPAPGEDASRWWPRLPGSTGREPQPQPEPDAPELDAPRKCYVCKRG